jgi:hypothetical protein
MCCFPNTGGLHCPSGVAPLETHNLIHHNPWQPITNCRMCAERSVTEDAFEGNSWGKSKCEWICCIPSTERLYHSSIDTPLKTHNNTHNTTWQPNSNWGVFAVRSIEEDAVGCNTHLPWCHVSKSNSSLSRRTQLAANAYKDKPHKSARHTTNTKGKSTPIENGINRLNISKMCKYVMLHQTGGFDIRVWITSGRTLLYVMDVTYFQCHIKYIGF